MARRTIYRGDSDEWTLSVPLTIWSAGGKFFFAVKAKGDINEVDATDANAVIKKTFDDTYISDTTATDKIYSLYLLPSETVDATPAKYKAQFKWMNSAAIADISDTAARAKTFEQFDYQIKGNINQRTA